MNQQTKSVTSPEPLNNKELMNDIDAILRLILVAISFS